MQIDILVNYFKENKKRGCPFGFSYPLLSLSIFEQVSDWSSFVLDIVLVLYAHQIQTVNKN